MADIYDVMYEIEDRMTDHPIAVASTSILALIGGLYAVYRISKKDKGSSNLPNYITDEKKQERRYTEEEYQQILRDIVNRRNTEK